MQDRYFKRSILNRWEYNPYHIEEDFLFPGEKAFPWTLEEGNKSAKKKSPAKKTWMVCRQAYLGFEYAARGIESEAEARKLMKELNAILDREFIEMVHGELHKRLELERAALRAEEAAREKEEQAV